MTPGFRCAPSRLRSLNSATLTLAYRHQQVETESVAAPFNDKDDGIDTTRGVVLGVNFAF